MIIATEYDAPKYKLKFINIWRGVFNYGNQILGDDLLSQQMAFGKSGAWVVTSQLV